MGDMADWVLDNGMDEYLDPISREWDDELEARVHAASALGVVCRCCGQAGLVWGVSNGKWRLFNGKGLHNCPTNPLRGE